MNFIAILYFGINCPSIAQHSVKVPDESSTHIKFTENLGQVSDQFHQPRPDILFYGNSGEMVYHLRKDGISYQLYRTESTEKDIKFNLPGFEMKDIPGKVTIYRTDIDWIGINPGYFVEKGHLSEGKGNYYLAVCPDGITGVKSYENIVYRNIYNGIDLKWHHRNGQLEYDYELEPGADYRQIKWSIRGATKLTIDDSGNLLIETPLGTISEKAPIAFQGGINIDVNWKIQHNELSFELGEYDKNLPVVIDPLVRVWSTYYGGFDEEFVHGCRLDASSNLFLPGFTRSNSTIATTGGHQDTYGGGSYDAFLVKLNNKGVRQWATYYGGSGDDLGYVCAIDANGNAYLGGVTASTSAMASAGSHQNSHGGQDDAFLVKFDNNGLRQWATYYGGTANDLGYGLITDASLNVYLCGETSSTTSISTAGSHQNTHGGSADAFLVKFNNSGTRQWATYYGGSSGDYSYSCAVDATSNVYLSGMSYSTTNIATPGSFQAVNKGNGDGFLIKFNNAGVRQWGTYYGGTEEDHAHKCINDNASAIYLMGYTNSTAGIASAGSYQSNYGGGLHDAFLAKFNDNGDRQWGTYYGGLNNDQVLDGSTVSNTHMFIVGHTNSTTGIATTGSYQNTFAGGVRDAFVVEFSSNGSRRWATYFGDTGDDLGFTCTIDKATSDLYLAGATSSANGISTAGSHQSSLTGSYDAFITQFGDCSSMGDPITTTACHSFTSPSGKHNWTYTGTYTDTLVNVASCDSFITVNLTVYPDSFHVSRTGNKFTASISGVSYQWLDCNNGNSVINGETGQNFTPASNGSYAVVVTQNGCTDTSACYNIDYVGIEQACGTNMLIYPNPVKDILHISMEHGQIDALIILRNGSGQVVYSGKCSKMKDSCIIDISSFPNGIYTVEISNDKFNVRRKLIKQD